ncbi:septal ring lytic transglycosylase RlpA family protein [Phenylobacterium sp.]|uniref:septal ring lytic transglycosylase RlpA family protein n=1 Tax=Phenylobacterium sp. TaxID=1871053 RepID=UPI0035B4B3D8
MIALPRSVAASRNLAIVLLAGASLAACATPRPEYPARFPQASGAGPAGRTPGAMPSGAGGRYKVGKPYQVGGIWYVPREDPNYDKRGVASWYGDQFQNQKTANGEIFDKNQLSAAHPTLPLPSIVEVTNLENGRSIRVRVNDRGPFVGGRIIDLSHEAARELGYDRQGLAKVRVRYVGPAPLKGERSARMEEEAWRAAAPTSPPPAAPAVVPPIAPPPVAQVSAPAEAAPERDVAWAEPAAPAAPDMAITQSELPPVASMAPPPINPPDEHVISMPRPVEAASNGFRVQAGAFGQLVNAQRAAAALSKAGVQAVIEPMERGGTTLYRVVAPAGPDEAQAWATRDLIADNGFFDAKVIGPF